MTPVLDPESIGPVDVASIIFEGNDFNGDVAPALAELQADGTIRILDLAFVYKDANGESSILEAEDADVADAFESATGQQFDLLNDEDLDAVAVLLAPGNSALVLVWEITWLARFASAVRASGGQLLSQDRIPRVNVLAAIAALDEE